MSGMVVEGLDILGLGIDITEGAPSGVNQFEDEELPQDDDGTDIDDDDDAELEASDDADDDDGADEADSDPALDAAIAEAKKQWAADVQENIRRFQQIKDREVAAANDQILQLSGQNQELLAFITREFTAENGFDVSKLSQLEVGMYRRRDQVQQQKAQSAAAWTEAQGVIQERFDGYSAEAVTVDGQQLADPSAVSNHKDVRAAHTAALRATEQWYASGAQTNTAAHKKAADALKHLRDTQQRVGKSLIAQSRQTKNARSQQRARQQQADRGPQARVSRTGGTGRWTDEKAWDVAMRQFPDDRQAAHRHYLALLDKHGIEG